MDFKIGRSEMISDRSAPENGGTELSVIVPAFNEAQGIAAFLDVLFGVLHGCCARFDVWVVDDRQEYCNADRFPRAQHLIVDTFETALRSLQIDTSTSRGAPSVPAVYRTPCAV